MTTTVEFINKLRNSGLRPTKQRIKICEVLFNKETTFHFTINDLCLLYTSPSPRDGLLSRMPSSA